MRLLPLLICAAIAAVSFSPATQATSIIPAGHLYFDKAGKPALQAPASWTLVSRSEKDGKQVSEYRFGLVAAPGQALAHVALRQIARSSRLADMTPEEGKAAERARDAAIDAMRQEVDAMPGVKFLSGGTQFIYTALDGGKRFHYVQYVNVMGVAREDSTLKPLVAVDLRCRSAVDDTAPTHQAAADELESRCQEMLLGLD